MDIILAIISSITAIVVTWIKTQQNKDTPKIQEISDKIFQLKEKTTEKLDSVSKDVKEIRDDMIGMNRSMATLKREIQDIHISHAKINTDQLKENFGKVIVLEEKSKAFEQMHMRTAKEIGKIKKVMEDD